MLKGIPNKKYTPEFKKLVVETMCNESLSYRETARRFEISNHDTVKKWNKFIWKEEAEGLELKRRSSSCANSGTIKGRKARFEKKKEEDLIAEVQRLTAENDCLKNLYALVLEKGGAKTKNFGNSKTKAKIFIENTSFSRSTASCNFL